MLTQYDEALLAQPIPLRRQLSGARDLDRSVQFVSDSIEKAEKANISRKRRLTKNANNAQDLGPLLSAIKSSVVHCYDTFLLASAAGGQLERSTIIVSGHVASSSPGARRPIVLLASAFPHVTQVGTYGATWSCGYRCIQMLSASLMQFEPHYSALYQGSKVVPTIAELQKHIEYAWARGFDAAGAESFPDGLANTKQWIGATEVVTLFRSFGCNARVVDFRLSRAGTGSGKAKYDNTPLGMWLLRYFSSAWSTHVAASAGAVLREVIAGGAAGAGGVMVPLGPPALNTVFTAAMAGGAGRADEVWDLTLDNNDVINVADSDDEQEDAAACDDDADAPPGSYMPPVYLQHQGHARIVAGVVLGSDLTDLRLVMFDPADRLDASTPLWSKVLVPLSALTSPEYQVVYVAPGMMDATAFEASKVIAAEQEHALPSVLDA